MNLFVFLIFVPFQFFSALVVVRELKKNEGLLIFTFSYVSKKNPPKKKAFTTLTREKKNQFQ